MKFSISFIIEDSRFDECEIASVLNSVKNFYSQFGHETIFTGRLRFHQPLFGYVLYFANSYERSSTSGRTAEITYGDWSNHYSNYRPHLVIHELNHMMFDCHDHYEGAVDFEPCSESCMMNLPSEGSLCVNCIKRLQKRQPSFFPLIVAIGVFTVPIWFPKVIDWLNGNQREI